MSRKFLIPLVAAALFAAPALMPAAMTGVSDSAMATTLKSSKSNSSDRMVMVWDERTNGTAEAKIHHEGPPAGVTKPRGKTGDEYR
jgi:hypothetical protein